MSRCYPFNQSLTRIRQCVCRPDHPACRVVGPTDNETEPPHEEAGLDMLEGGLSQAVTQSKKPGARGILQPPFRGTKPLESPVQQRPPVGLYNDQDSILCYNAQTLSEHPVASPVHVMKEIAV